MRRLFSAAVAVFRKDLLLEFRTRTGLNTVFLFVLISVAVALFSLAGEALEQMTLAALFWNTVFFSAMASLQRAFVSEAERGTDLFLKLSASPAAIFLGKLTYNFLLALAVNAVIAILYVVLLELKIENLTIFLLVMVLGSASVSGALTLISAIVATASGRNSLFAVLSFPVLLPAMLLVIKATKISTMEDAPLARAETELQLLSAYAAVMTIASFLLFEFVWED